MRWYHTGAGMLALMMMAGCPTEFGKDGRVNKAVRKDSLELVKKVCPESTFRAWCSDGRENTPECIRECG